MKYCPYCGADLLKENAAFCMECGKQLSVKEEKPGPEQEHVPEKPIKSKQKKRLSRQRKRRNTK